VGKGRCKQLYGHQSEYNLICKCNPLKQGFHTRNIQNFSSSLKVPLRVWTAKTRPLMLYMAITALCCDTTLGLHTVVISGQAVGNCTTVPSRVENDNGP